MSKRKKLEGILKKYLDVEFSTVINIPNLTVDFNEISRKYKFSFAQKALHCSDVGFQEIERENADIYLAVYLRSFFELLIFLKLCERDVKFKIALYVLSVERVMSEQSNLINSLTLECNRLKNIENQEKIKVQELVNQLKNPESAKEEIISKISNLAKEPFDVDFGIYNTEAETLGLGFTAYHIETNILPNLKNELTTLDQANKNFFQDLLETEFFNNIYPGVTEEDLIKTLQNTISGPDLKTWEKKAKLVGLENEYNFVYKLTSNLIHSTSYSIFSKVKLSIIEKDLIMRMSLECLIQVVKILLPDEYISYRNQVINNN